MKKLYLYIIFIFILFIFLIWIVNPNILVMQLFDDSFFYLEIAKNLAIGNGNTFDGINKTNGFHTSYLLLNSIFYYIINPNKFDGIRMLITIDTILFFIGIFILTKNFKKQNFNNLEIFLFINCLFFLYYIKDFGIETKLMFPFMILILTNNNYSSKKNIFYYSIPIFIRKDYILLTILYISYNILEKFILKKNQINFKNIFFDFFILALFLSASILFDIFLWNEAFSISSKLKLSHYPFPTQWYMPLSNITFYKMIVFLLISFLLIIFLLMNWKNNYKNFLIFSFFGFSYILIVLTFSNGGVGLWYINTIQYSVTLIIIVFLINYLKKQSKLYKYFPFISFLTTIFIPLNIYLAYNKYINKITYLDSIKLIEYITINHGNEPIIFQVDESGKTGYFYDGILINGDGLVNNQVYQNYLHKNEIVAYLKTFKVSHIIDNNFNINKMRNKYYRIEIPKWSSKSIFIDIPIDFYLYNVGKYVVFEIKNFDKIKTIVN